MTALPSERVSRRLSRVRAVALVGLAVAVAGCGSTHASYSVRQVRAAFASHGMKLTPHKKAWNGEPEPSFRSGKVVVALEKGATPDDFVPPAGTVVGDHTAVRGNVVVSYPAAQRKAVEAALASLR